MNSEILKKAGIDYDACVKRFAGRAAIFEKALCKFVKDTAFHRVREAYAVGDEAALLASAHEFKGMCGNIGLMRQYQAADDIVKALRDEAHTPGQIASLYGKLESAYDEAFKAVEAAMEDA